MQSGASGCEKGFVKRFLKVPLACLDSPTACGILGKHFTKPFSQPDAPDCIMELASDNL